MSKPKKLEVKFAPGCFDNFEGTQEELDAFIEEIHQMAESGELLSQAVSIDDLDDEMLRTIAEDIGQADKSRLQ